MSASKIIPFPGNTRPMAGHTEDATIIIMPVVRVERAVDVVRLSKRKTRLRSRLRAQLRASLTICK